MSMASAVSKLRSEMDQNKTNSYVQVVGNYLLKHLEKYPNDAGRITASSKTILKSLDAMREVAGKKKIGNCGVLAPQEGFDIVMKYFDIAETDGLTLPSSRPPATPSPKAKDIDFDVSLEDFL